MGIDRRWAFCGLLVCALLGHRSSALRLQAISALPSVARRLTASLTVSAALLTIQLGLLPAHADEETKKSISEIVVKMNGEKRPMKEFLGKEATLVVNFAGQCGNFALVSEQFLSNHFVSISVESIMTFFIFFVLNRECFNQ